MNCSCVTFLLPFGWAVSRMESGPWLLGCSIRLLTTVHGWRRFGHRKIDSRLSLSGCRIIAQEEIAFWDLAFQLSSIVETIRLHTDLGSRFRIVGWIVDQWLSSSEVRFIASLIFHLGVPLLLLMASRHLPRRSKDLPPPDPRVLCAWVRLLKSLPDGPALHKLSNYSESSDWIGQLRAIAIFISRYPIARPAKFTFHNQHPVATELIRILHSQACQKLTLSFLATTLWQFGCWQILSCCSTRRSRKNFQASACCSGSQR